MKSKIYRDLLILLVACIGIWVIFSRFPIFPEESPIKVPIATEEKLGKMIVDELILSNDTKEVNKPYSDSCLNVMKLRLLRSMGNTEYEYKFILIDSPIVNAAALPGGYVVIFSGLIDFCQNAEELSAVLAHEIGHVEKKHIVNKLAKELGLSLILSTDKSVVGSVARMATSTAFDRKQEEEADKFAMDLLLRTKISPRIVGLFFTRIEEKYGTDRKNIQMLSTHPFNNARIKTSFEYPVPKEFKSVGFDFDWKKFQEEMKGKEEKEEN